MRKQSEAVQSVDGRSKKKADAGTNKASVYSQQQADGTDWSCARNSLVNPPVRGIQADTVKQVASLVLEVPDHRRSVCIQKRCLNASNATAFIHWQPICAVNTEKT